MKASAHHYLPGVDIREIKQWWRQQECHKTTSFSEQYNDSAHVIYNIYSLKIFFVVLYKINVTRWNYQIESFVENLNTLLYIFHSLSELGSITSHCSGNEPYCRVSESPKNQAYIIWTGMVFQQTDLPEYFGHIITVILI